MPNLFIIVSIISIFIALIIYCCIKNKKYNEFFIGVNDIPLHTDRLSKTPSNIKYQIPVAQNQLTDEKLRDLDSDILRNVRVLKTFTTLDELDFYQMYNILKKFKSLTPTFIYKSTNKKNYHQLNNDHIKTTATNLINVTNLELFFRLKLELISILNHLIIQHNYYLPYHKYQFFKIINSNLISKTTLPSADNYIFTLTVAREFKYQQFVIYFDIVLQQPQINTKNNLIYNIKINNIELIGIPIPNTIEFHKHPKLTLNNQNDNSQKTIIDLIEQKQQYIDDNIDDNVVSAGINLNSEEPHGVSENMFKYVKFFDAKFIDVLEKSDIDENMFNNTNQYIMKIAKDQQLKNHRCYGLVNGINKELVEYNNPSFCESYHPEINQVGIWDAPCQINNDCPFYQSNKNYPNEFGKCNINTGTCELPMGVIPIGFTKYGKIEPQCYNCGKEYKNNKCCSKQYNDIKNGKVNYKTPDYIFIGDEQLRNQNSTILKQNGLNSNPSI